MRFYICPARFLRLRLGDAPPPTRSEKHFCLQNPANIQYFNKNDFSHSDEDHIEF